jgi:hypothetical protein
MGSRAPYDPAPFFLSLGDIMDYFLLLALCSPALLLVASMEILLTFFCIGYILAALCIPIAFVTGIVINHIKYWRANRPNPNWEREFYEGN